tara:strand:+ start:3061 stop:3684 length:624 start_codon:yes stop_codon:yes gene_type:complete
MDEHVGSVHADRLRVALDTVLDSAGFASLRREVQRQRTAQTSRLDARTETTDSTKSTAVSTQNAYASKLATNEIDQIDAARQMRDLADRIRKDHLRPEDVKRQIVLIDAVLGLVAKKVKSGELKVRVSDIPALLKARAAITGLPMDLTSQQQQSPQLHQHAHVHVVESVRMRDARATGDDSVVLDAMRSEVDDLRVILNAVPDRRGQ